MGLKEALPMALDPKVEVAIGLVLGETWLTIAFEW